ncbi:MAG: tetratricopeptide repeat protein [Candidatus Obscuribacterales bacterium]|nr:tetratricopeptide repeat protein [Candidatus Obscuribacterales bacterium]
MFRSNKQVALAIAVLHVLTGVQCGNAEGFPGKGDRVQYAESLPHYNLGNRYLAKEWYEKAIEKYNDAINIYPFDADVYTNLTVAYRKVGDVAGAEAACRKAVELNHNDWTSWSNLGNILMTQERFPESYRCFTKAMSFKSMPSSERTFIESNIDGMKKIMKARGLTLTGESLSPPAVNDGKSVATKGSGSASGKKLAGKANAVKKVAGTTTRPTRDLQGVGSKESELDRKAYDDWLVQ